jgi:hypothetical protein
VICTDLAPVIELANEPNLARNRPRGDDDRIRTEVLDWDDHDASQIERLRRGGGPGDDARGDAELVLLAADVLYNPSSHQAFLSTVLKLLDGVKGYGLVAYRKRTEGDDAFFDMARLAGLKVGKCGGWGDVSIWRMERDSSGV